MTTKEIAEISGVSVDTVTRKIKELYPDEIRPKRATNLVKEKAIRVMSELRKMGFINPLPQNAEALPQNAEDSISTLESAFKMMATAFDKLVSISQSQETRLQKIETRIDERQALLPAPQIEPREHINMIVRDYSTRAGIEFREVWRELYKQFSYRTNSNPSISAKNRGMTIIDYIESEGMIETLESIAMDCLK